LTAAGSPALITAAADPDQGRRRPYLTWLGVVPFFAYVGIFLLLPTAIILAGSLVAPNGGIDLSNYLGINKPYIYKSFVTSVEVSAVSAVAGAILGALLAYAVVTGNPDGFLRRTVMSAAGVIAQF